jgi:hypothetical protein
MSDQIQQRDQQAVDVTTGVSPEAVAAATAAFEGDPVGLLDLSDTDRDDAIAILGELRRGVLCPGHVGRGTGDVCCICDKPIPDAKRRKPGDRPEHRHDCPACQRFAPHVHNVAWLVEQQQRAAGRERDLQRADQASRPGIPSRHPFRESGA